MAARVLGSFETKGTLREHQGGYARPTSGHSFSAESFRFRRFRGRRDPRVPSLPASELNGKEGVDGSSPSEGLIYRGFHAPRDPLSKRANAMQTRLTNALQSGPLYATLTRPRGGQAGGAGDATASADRDGT
jgi:hypothetical protein